LFTHGGAIGLLEILIVWTEIITNKNGASTSAGNPSKSGDELAWDFDILQIWPTQG
jgi:hypothetical protein